MQGINTLRFTFLGVGLVMIGIAVFLWYNTIGYLAEAVEVDGRVVRNLSFNEDDGTMYSPLIIFETKTGDKVEFVDRVRSRPAQYETNEIVSILYLPNDPTDARVRSFFSLWGAFSIVGGIGLIFELVGIIFLFVKV